MRQNLYEGDKFEAYEISLSQLVISNIIYIY